MNENGDGVIDLPGDAAERALSGHHLDEVAQMIEQALADKPSYDRPFTDGPAE
ncbi:MAG: hypothetical protein JO243_11475 [Solirubrobacterales bacterium]|nr:hypothetical protein [Solirubrobacterales bacterium]